MADRGRHSHSIAPSASGATTVVTAGGNVRTRRHLKVTVRNQNGSSIPGATVNLYSRAWSLIDSRLTSDDGVAAWIGLRQGTYNLDVYYNEEYWANGSSAVRSGVTTSISLQRNEPYAYDFKVYSGSSEVTGYAVPVNRPLRYEIRVRNSSPVSRSVRIRFVADRDQTRPYDFGETGGAQTISAGGTMTFNFNHTPRVIGTYARTFEAETSVNGNWLRTDGWAWGLAEHVVIDLTPLLGHVYLSAFPVWGFADLHAHLGAHLAFGSDANGDEGIFYGKPGMRLEDANASMPNDLASCNREKHSGFDADPVRHKTRQVIMQKVNQIIGGTHGSGGFPSFNSWPNAMNGNHQQMHVTWLRRAYEGGLRVLVASAVENLSFSTLWRNGTNFSPPSLQVSSQDEFNVAVKQIEFIRRFVDANHSWMQIVTTAAEARAAVQNNKMAVILGTELDTLSVDQLIRLKNEQGVRLVIPVHMADNAIGGTAVYGDVFNTHNYIVNKEFYGVVADANLRFRLGVPLHPRVEGSIAIWDGPGAIVPTPIERGQYCSLGYTCCPEAPVPQCIAAPTGMKNKRRLTDPAGLERLMREGLLIDIVHMSDLAQEDSVRVAQRFNYPVLNSHTGLRGDHEVADNERAMRVSLAVDIARLGGVLGLGTGGLTSGGLDERRAVFKSTRYVRFTGEQKSMMIAVGPYDNAPTAACGRLRIVTRTGGDDLRGGGDSANLLVKIRGMTHTIQLSRGANWGNGSTNSIVAALPSNTRVSDIQDIVLEHTNRWRANADNWNVDELGIECGSAGQNLLTLTRDPLMRFTGDNQTWRANLPASGSGEVQRLSFTIRTGGDDLRGGNDNAYATIHAAGRDIECPLNRGQTWGNNQVHTVTCDLPAGTQRSSLEEIRIRTTFGGGLFGDNWNMDSITVSVEEPGTRVVQLTGSPLIRFTLQQRVRHVYTPRLSPELHENPDPSILRIWIWTTSNDLRGENDNATGVFEFHDGSRHEVPLNRGGQWGEDSHYGVMVRFPSGKRWSDIRAFGITTTFTGGIAGDNWDIGNVTVEAFEDPLNLTNGWGKALETALNAMGGRGVALGTDLNGYAPQVPMTSTSVDYPITLPVGLGPHDRTVTLARSQSGDRVFDISRDGIAHIGMLPDFLYAASRHLGTSRVRPIFRSAEDVIQMWERVEAASRAMPR